MIALSFRLMPYAGIKCTIMIVERIWEKKGNCLFEISYIIYEVLLREYIL